MNEKSLPFETDSENDLHYRLNKQGDDELVNGDEETLNELVTDISQLIDGGVITNMTASMPQTVCDPEILRANSDLEATIYGDIPQNKYISDYQGNKIDYGVTQESFTGTSNLAIPPTPYSISSQISDEDEEVQDSELTTESIMGQALLQEWLPEFDAGDYDPGDAQMPSPTGDGVSARTPTRSKVGRYDTDMTNDGEAWPRKHNETPAMCDVDDDGVEHKPQGVHKSTPGKADDGIQSEVGHNWPDEPTNSGNGVAEPLEGERWSDGGVLKSGSGPNEFDNSGHNFGLPKDGPITGTKGNQQGQSESWSPNNIGKLMSEDYDLQTLFNNYAKNNQQVCLEDFQGLCNAHGIDVYLDETSILRLMDVNKEFMFHEHRDSDGKYWLSEAVDPSLLSELQVRSPERESQMYTRSDFSPYDEDAANDMYGGDPHMRSFSNVDSTEYDDRLDSMEPTNQLECSGCGYAGPEDECPECGMPMSEINDDEYGNDDEFGDFKSGKEFEPAFNDDFGMPSRGRQETHFSPRMMESAQNFLVSARSIIESSKNKKGIGEALTYSWAYHTNNADPSIFPVKVQKMLESIHQHYPNFTISEAGSDVIDPPDGIKIGSNGSNSKLDSLPEQPGMDKFEKHGDVNLLNHKQHNNLEGEPSIAGTGKGLNEGVLKTNFQKLTRYIKTALSENAPAVRGKYKVHFEVAVIEGKGKNKKKNKTPKRNGLSEALADVEEILQFHNPNDVTLETSFVDSSGSIVFKHDVPLMTINQRGPVFAENKTLFRFRRNAEDFAQELVAEGVACKVMPHNWGCAVDGQFDEELAETAFALLTEKKKENWIQGAINKDHKGFCTPMTKSTCTPKRKALAKRFKKGGDLHN